MKPPKAPLRILLEMRPALEGHAGIPQETRLLFRGLSMLDNVQVEGLLQSGDQLLARGLPPSGKGWFGPLSRHWQLNRLGRVVISLEDRKPLKKRSFGSFVKVTAHTVAMGLWHT